MSLANYNLLPEMRMHSSKNRPKPVRTGFLAVNKQLFSAATRLMERCKNARRTKHSKVSKWLAQ